MKSQQQEEQNSQSVLTSGLLFLAVGRVGQRFWTHWSPSPCTAVWLEFLWSGKGLVIFGFWKGSQQDRQARLWVTESEPIGGEAVIPFHFQLRKWVERHKNLWQGSGEHATLTEEIFQWLRQTAFGRPSLGPRSRPTEHDLAIAPTGQKPSDCCYSLSPECLITSSPGLVVMRVSTVLLLIFLIPYCLLLEDECINFPACSIPQGHCKTHTWDRWSAYLKLWVMDI